jgi:tripartite-type tricarboxylate transporter receptor subunit TctC
MDLYPRTLQPFIKKYLPWKKGEVVMENMAGAESVTGSREIFFSKPDGYTIGTIQTRAVLFPQLLGQVAKFDLTKYTFLGQFNNFPTHLITGTKHPFLKSALDLKKVPRPFTYAMASGGDIGTEWMMKEKMKLNVKPIFGYKSSKESQVAIMQGEIDTTTMEYSSYASLYKSGDIKPLFHFGDRPVKFAPEIPSLRDLGYEEFAGKLTVDRTIVGPPNIPEDRVQILRKAIWEALNDPKFIEMSEKGERFLDVQNGENAREISLSVVNFWTKYGEEIKKEMVESGYR